MSADFPSDTQELLDQLERIGQGDFGNSLADFPPPPPPPPPSEDLPDLPTDLPPAPDPSDEFESVVTFSKGSNSSPNKSTDLPAPPSTRDSHKPIGGVTVNVKSKKLPPKIPSKTEKARAIGRASTLGGLATSDGSGEEGFVSVSALKRQFERGPNKLTGTTITPIANMPQVPGPPIPQRVSSQPQPIRSPYRPPLPAEFAPAKTMPAAELMPAKTMPAVNSKPAESLDDLLSDLNQVASRSDFPPPPPLSTGPVSINTAEGPGVSGGVLAKRATWFLVVGSELTPADVAVIVIGPSGPIHTKASQSGDGVRVEYTPSVAGEYSVETKVGGRHIPGSPFMVTVDFAEFTDKCTADGMGLINGKTGEPCSFVIRCGPDAVVARLRVHILGPSKAEPIEMTEEDKLINVTYHPTSPGQYRIKIIWAEAHIAGSPFLVNVGGEALNDVSKLKIEGEGLKGGHTNEPLRIQVLPETGAGSGPLSIKISGPTKPSIVAEEAEDSSITVTYTCRDPGHYDIHLRWGNEDIPGFPMGVKVTGEGRVSDGSLCTAHGEGMVQGEVNSPAEFEVHIDENAGPGPLAVSVLGPFPASPIQITPLEGLMKIRYHPVAPGDYQIQVTWGGKPISGSPFIAHVTGKAVRDSSKVYIEGFNGEVKANQLATFKVISGEGAGPGPLRAKLSGRTKAEMSLMKSEDGSMSVSFLATEKGKYILELLWGDDEESGHILGSPFDIEVV